jgi:hypothetical protein
MLQRAKYNDMEPDAVDFFGECMNSPQSGRTPLANEIYVSYKMIGYIYCTQLHAWSNTVLWTSYLLHSIFVGTNGGKEGKRARRRSTKVTLQDCC